MQTLAVYLIPYDGIGGVESAARSLPTGSYPALRFQKAFLAGKLAASDRIAVDYHGQFASENDIRNYIQLLAWLHVERPAVLVTSLWRCYLVGIIFKCMHPSVKLVCFLHLPTAVHFLDRWSSLTAMALAAAIWGDSRSTLETRVPPRWRLKAETIPMLCEREVAVDRGQPRPLFVFWGRITQQKDLGRAVTLVRHLSAIHSETRFLIIGPDGGDQRNVEQLCQHTGIADRVQFVGSQNRDAIARLARHCSFYIQTSRFEGMAMSVVEAMQFGLVPVVTPVGEIANYCRDGLNSIYVTDPDTTARRIADVLDDPRRYAELRQNAIDTWRDTPLYRDAVLDQLRSLLGCRDS